MAGTWKEVLAVLKKGGFEYCDLFPIIAAAYITRKWGQEPLWILVVGPPGSGKTATAKLFSRTKDITLISSLTPASLISGWGGEDLDRSLLKDLDGRLLVAKDFGTLLSTSWATANEVFGILREAFDGHVSKNFGMMRREYWLHFNFVAMTTEASERHRTLQVQLGERFLRYAHAGMDLGVPPPVINEAVFESISGWADDLTLPEPKRLGKEDAKFIARLADSAARLRTEVIHADAGGREVMEIPGFEGPTRLYFQMSKLYRALTMILGSKREAARIVRKVARSAVKARKATVVSYLLAHPRCTINQVADSTLLSYTVIYRLLNDYFVMGLVVKERTEEGYPKEYEWRIAKQYKKQFTEFFQGG